MTKRIRNKIRKYAKENDIPISKIITDSVLDYMKRNR